MSPRDPQDNHSEAGFDNIMSVNSVEQMATIPVVEKRGIPARLLIDALTALTAAITVSPIVAAVDK